MPAHIGRRNMKKPKIKLKLPNIAKRKREDRVLPVASRITNETVAEHREQILAGGRKFKYPVQYVRYRLVINTTIIVIASLLLMGALAWWQLYPMQSSNVFFYRVTRVLPLPVAVVNGEQVLYRDYLVEYRLSEYYLSKYGEIKLDSDDGKRQLNYFKRQSMDKAIATAYARQVARQSGISVTDKDVDDLITKERHNAANGVVSQETYDTSMRMLYDQTPTDYRLWISNSILRSRVAFAVDSEADAQIKQVAKLTGELKTDFAKVAERMVSAGVTGVTSGQSGFIDNTRKFFGLRVAELAQYEEGQVTGILQSETRDGYYIVKIIEKTNSQTNFTYIHVPLKKMDEDLMRLREEGKISEYISIGES